MKMTIYKEGKRIVSRAVTFIDDKVILMERHRLDNGVMLHYFTIPGGGVEEGESYRDAAIRETLEETCCNIEIVKDMMVEDFGEGICHWFFAKYISGTPELGGEEKVRNNPDNHYKVVLININDIDNINILGQGRNVIKECYKEYKKGQ